MPHKPEEQCRQKANTLMKHRIQAYNTFHIPSRLRLPSQFWIFLFLLPGNDSGMPSWQ